MRLSCQIGEDLFELRIGEDRPGITYIHLDIHIVYPKSNQQHGAGIKLTTFQLLALYENHRSTLVKPNI